MRSWALCSLPLVIGAAMLAPAAHAQNTDDTVVCSDMTIAGDYAFRVSGVVFEAPVPTPPTPPTINLYLDAVGMMHFDGNGNITQQDFALRNSRFTPVDLNPNGNGFNIDEHGTYQVFPDCTGNTTILFQKNDTVIMVLDLQFVIGENGRTIHAVGSKLQSLINGILVTIPVNAHRDAERVH